jgi:endo-1,4-beta-xylanase
MTAAWIIALSLSLSGHTAALPDDSPGAKELLRGADARIERLRKADATILVVDREGNPVPGVQIKVEQIRHSFLFGCAAISLLKHKDLAQELRYQEQFAGLFNFATVLTYWQDTDPEPNRQNLDKLTAQVDWLRKQEITVKGHPLILAGAAPKWAPTDPDQARAVTEKRIKGLAGRFNGQIDVWDVVGDATTAAGAQNGLGAWARKAGPSQFTADALTWARSATPRALLLYNDYKLDSDYTNLVKDLVKAHAPLDTLGLEAHMVGSEWPLEKVWDTAETFSKLGKPLHFSEITVLSDTQKADHSNAWPSTPEGEQRQADYVEKMYTLLFSHPGLTGIAWWNFVDGDWDRIPGGLLRSDITPKPAYDRLLDLIKKKWWTTASLTTDFSGRIKFRGFKGRYRITLQTPTGTSTIEGNVVGGKSNEFRFTVE